jgi:hypothetical protein
MLIQSRRSLAVLHCCLPRGTRGRPQQGNPWKPGTLRLRSGHQKHPVLPVFGYLDFLDGWEWLTPLAAT